MPVRVGTSGFLVFVSSVSVPPLLTLSLSFCNTVLSALMTHISYLQLLPNPSSAGSGTDYCFQTPEERGAEQGGGWRVERDASVIQYTERLRGPAHAYTSTCLHQKTSPKNFFHSKYNYFLSLLCSFFSTCSFSFAHSNENLHWIFDHSKCICHINNHSSTRQCAVKQQSCLYLQAW